MKVNVALIAGLLCFTTFGTINVAQACKTHQANARYIQTRTSLVSDTQFSVLFEDDAKDPNVQRLFQKLKAIPGVTGVALYKYEMRIEKADNFKWSEITPQANKLVKEFETKVK
jgi:cell division protein FtsX